MWAAEFATSVDVHAESLTRDDAEEALHQLLSYLVSGDTIGRYLSLIVRDHLKPKQGEPIGDAIRITRAHDLVVKHDGEQPGLYIRNGSPALERIFKDTRWAEGAWMTALRKLEGSFTVKNPIYFTSRRGKSRAIGLPLDYIETIDEKVIF